MASVTTRTAVDLAPRASGNDLEQAKKSYMLPNDHQEIKRMNSQHEWIKGAFGGLINAPIDYDKKHQKILDSATADGTWLCDLSSLFPTETEMVGFDIAPELYPPADVLPSNVKLVPGDLSKDLPADWAKHFDLVHQRFVFPSFSNETIGQFLGRLMACVKPGGWIQLVEPIANENVSGPDPTAFTVLHKLADMCMQSPNPKDVILSKLKEGGFVNINIQTLDIVVGGFQENRELGVRGRKMMEAALMNMAAIAGPKLAEVSDISLDTLVDRFNADTQKYRTAVRHFVIWAQRPE